MSTIPVSVVIPAYNRERSIARAIQSVRAQTEVVASEVIVADDASTDNTVAIVEEHGATVLRSATNLGAGPTRNRAIAAATQPWLAFLDSDDEWLPDHLRILWSKSDRYSFVSSTALSIESNGRAGRLWGSALSNPQILSTPLDAIVPENPIVTSSVLVKKELVTSAGMFRPLRRAQDLDLWIRVLARTPALVLPDVTIRYFRGEDQAINDVALMNENLRRIFADYSDADWHTRFLDAQGLTARHWDELRKAITARESIQGLKSALWFAAHPYVLSALFKLTNRRRKMRIKSAAYLASARFHTPAKHVPNDV